MIIDVDYRILEHVERKRDLQKFYKIDGDKCVFVIAHNNVVMRSVVPYETTEEFRLNFLDKALRVNDLLIESDLLAEIRDLLDRREFRELRTEVKPEKPNVHEEASGVPNKIEPINVSGNVEETKPDEIDMDEILDEI